MRRRGAVAGADGSFTTIRPFVGRISDWFGRRRHPQLSYLTLQPFVTRVFVDRTRVVKRPHSRHARPRQSLVDVASSTPSSRVESVLTTNVHHSTQTVVTNLHTVTPRTTSTRVRTSPPTVVSRPDAVSQRPRAGGNEFRRGRVTTATPVDTRDSATAPTTGDASSVRTSVTESNEPLRPVRRHLVEPRTTLARATRGRPTARWRPPNTSPQWMETEPNLRVTTEPPARVGWRRSSRTAERQIAFGPTAVNPPDKPTLTVRTTPSSGRDDTTNDRRSGPATTSTSTSSTGVGPGMPATNGHATATPTPLTPAPTLDLSTAPRAEVDRLVDRLYDEFARKLRVERERRGR
ncbi:hypothetical protein SAMN04487948_12918 [Halogranum amylolyticum]|uniref:Uncharacterized protein n=1 Tax=Halogranum amylolyticum TaxID=660520 RepID=A0A1H8WG36_9EURY|nr:hypothetical protein SAMN04487948_12918 [Halogranum amylolyticum]